jgi:hypothetical protein
VQVDPIKSKLKLPGTKHLNLKSDKPLSNVDFEFNLRRYTAGPELVDAARHRVAAVRAEAPAADVPARAGALGRAVQVDPIKPNLKPAGTNRLKLKYDKSLSTFAFEFKLRRYSWMERRARRDPPGLCLPVPALHRHNVPVTLSWYEASVVQLYSEAFDASFDDVIRLCSGFGQGLTLVHSSAQRKRLLCDRGCSYGLFRGCLGGVGGYWGVFRVCFCVRNGSS